MKTTIGGFVMTGKKGMKKYPIWIREKIFEESKEGKRQKQIRKEYGIRKYALQNWIDTRPQRNTTTKQRGRKPAKTLQEYKYENKRLKMENELLRDFLSLTERK